MIVLPTMRAIIGAAGGAASDPYFASVVHLAHFDGVNGGTSFPNSCPLGAPNFVASGSGSVVTDTSTAVFGTASAHLTGGGGTKLAPSSADSDYQFLTNDFTLELWIRAASLPAATYQCIFNYGDTYSYSGLYVYGDALQLYQTGANVTTASVLTATTWHFVSYSRSGANGFIHVDGIHRGTWASDSLNYTGVSFNLGNEATHTFPFTGHFDDCRITNGVARYPSTSTYSVPATAFPDA